MVWAKLRAMSIYLRLFLLLIVYFIYLFQYLFIYLFMVIVGRVFLLVIPGQDVPTDCTGYHSRLQC